MISKQCFFLVAVSLAAGCGSTAETSFEVGDAKAGLRLTAEPREPSGLGFRVEAWDEAGRKAETWEKGRQHSPEVLAVIARFAPALRERVLSEAAQSDVADAPEVGVLKEAAQQLLARAGSPGRSQQGLSRWGAYDSCLRSSSRYYYGQDRWEDFCACVHLGWGLTPFDCVSELY